MKANELMIGDWVHVDGVQVDDDGKNPVYQLLARRVEGLRKGVVEIDHYEFPPCLCMPISLTREILELNNFQKDPDYIDTYWRPDCRKFCFVKENDDWYFAFRYKGGHICIAECNYVHELQHDLKRCGIEKEIVL